MVEPLRDQLDAVVVFPSMPEVMRLNKVGSFTMQNLGQSKSVVSDFMKKKKKVRWGSVASLAWHRSRTVQERSWVLAGGVDVACSRVVLNTAPQMGP